MYTCTHSLYHHTLPSPSTPALYHHTFPSSSTCHCQDLPLWWLPTSWGMRESPYLRPTPFSKRDVPSSVPTSGSGSNSLTMSIIYFKRTLWMWLNGMETQSFLIFTCLNINIYINWLIASDLSDQSRTYIQVRNVCGGELKCHTVIFKVVKLCNVDSLLL